MPTVKKEKMVQELAEKFAQAQAVIFTDYRGLDVKTITSLRKQLRDVGVEYKVVKNTLTSLAINQNAIEGLDPAALEGPTALAFSYEDPVAPAKVLATFAKENKTLAFKAGLLRTKAISVAEIKALAELPSREVLLAQVVGTMQAPIVALVGTMQGTIRKFVATLDAVRAKKEAEA